MPAQLSFVRCAFARASCVLLLLTVSILTLLSTGCPSDELAELAPCTHAVGRAQVDASPTFKVDLLFVVDDSGSMKDEQDSLARELPNLVRVLTSGELDEQTSFRPVDLHVGVISTDMGDVPSPWCDDDTDDDGKLIVGSACGSATVPAPDDVYLSFEPGQTDAKIDSCRVELGTMGCGIEQQLEAALKALTPKKSDIEFADGNSGHGTGANEGFLRSDSLLVVLTVTDEDDCSAPSLDFLGDAPNDVEIACAFNPQKLYPISRYVEGLKALRPDQPDRVLFAAITGVPPDLVADPKNIDYEAILSDERMQFRSDGAAAPELVQSCEEEGVGIARPPRRIVEVARAFGKNGLVQSICKRDYRGALTALLARIAELVGPACLPRKLHPDGAGRVSCRVIETVPSDATCADKPGRTPLDEGAQGGEASRRCEIAQVAVVNGKPGAGAGWYYDALDAEGRCPDDTGRISFTSEGMVSPGARVSLECLEPVVSAADSSRNEDAAGLPCASDRECQGHVDDERDDLSLICEPGTLTCQVSCETDAQCQAPSVCDVGLERPVCVNPTCP